VRGFRFVLAALILLSVGAYFRPAPAQQAAPTAVGAAGRFMAHAGPGPLTVETLLGEWTDNARQRTIPFKAYYPTDGVPPFPVIVFSHGLGGSREGYEFQGRHWASHGYVSVHLQHPGSDDSVWRDVPPAQRIEAMREALKDLRAAVDRPLDVRFAIDQLTAMSTGEGPLAGKLDLAHIGIAGHSFGAWTAQIVAGQLAITPQQELSLADPRVSAAVFESPNHTNRVRDPERAYGTVRIPCLHLTGTEDHSPFEGLTRADERVVPFGYMDGSDQYLCVFEGGDHMVFSGRIAPRPRPKDERFQSLIKAMTLAFFDAYLKGDEEARAMLSGDAIPTELGADGRFTAKPRPK